MSCCETNLGDQTTFADQPLTLSTGYLCAGARGVIGTLWSVDDRATALFSSIYHYYRSQGISRAQALQQTQQNFRSTSELTKLFTEQFQQAAAQQKQARTRRDQYPTNSFEHQYWKEITERHAQQAQSFRNMKADIANLGTSTSQNPYTNEYYWAAFTCNGLG